MDAGDGVTVYVDELRRYPTKIRCFVAGSCHMMADTVEELLRVADRSRRLLPHDAPVLGASVTAPSRIDMIARILLDALDGGP